jgi:CheY-like chemotaxis protein
MDPKILDFIFEPFFTTKGVGHGTGLGLSTVYGIVKQNKGHIEVSSEPDKGTTFRIYLPKIQEEIQTVSSEDLQLSVLQGSETILLVEDEATMLEVTAVMLEKMGHTVFTASGPSDAIRFVEEYPNDIQLLITDVVMPGMNGKDLASELLSRVPSLKCLFMSGYAADALSHIAKLGRGTHFIQKPFALGDLMPKVRAALDGV